MITHHIQKHIIATLVEHKSARYADIKPAQIEGNVFTYHLKYLLSQKLIQKNLHGRYELTDTGKLLGINASVRQKDVLRQAHAILLLGVCEGSSWLLRKRLVQPLYGKVGFIHGEPRPEERITDAARRILQSRTGLTGDATVKGAGFVGICEGEKLVTYVNFTYVSMTHIQGDLIAQDKHGENAWYQNPDFAAPIIIPSMSDIVSAAKGGDTFFIDTKYVISENDTDTY